MYSGFFENVFNINYLRKEKYTMKSNMGTIDRIIRTIIAIVIGVLYFAGQISGTLAIVLGTLAIIFLLTSFVSRCPIYLPFGISTKKMGDK